VLKARERYKKLVSSRDIPEIQQLLTENSYETEGHTVSIVELNMQDLSKKNALIGDNKGSDSNTENEVSDTESRHSEEIVGMSLKGKKEKRSKSMKERIENNGTDVKKEIKRIALKKVKGSKVFQQKQKLERQKNRKESLRKRKRVEKIQKRKGKKLKKYRS
ncbi:uncharacterized protein LOC108632480, partial [Ceratina calcarata]|uniref:Uncharacterized protein LOC108624528 n=1 Tax=Ceratina calcarata TaxID=156304 RepID=A0AAJ7N624_9HYME